MKVGNQYIIPFRGLALGIHTFSFVISNEFFEEYSELEIPEGKINAEVTLTKKTSLLDLGIVLNGSVKLQCDRCLGYFDFNIDIDTQLFVKFKEEPEEPDENVMFLHPNDDLLDLGQFFLDNIGLNIPIQKYHPRDKQGHSTCDKNMMDYLSKHSARETKNSDDNIDPRWSKLKDLLNEGNKNE
ncbi:MAG: DUF177 domain-containing protein [Bacteroidales bacterium]|nr:DUF177 domain-containing protein [Bacteroidales bacterium]